MNGSIGAELLSCMICMEEFDDDRKRIVVLEAKSDNDVEAGANSCGHSLCEECAGDIFDRARGFGRPAECPQCKQVLSGYSRNYFAETLRDFIIKSKAKQANNENNNNANPFNNILNNNYQNQPAEVDPFQQAKNENMEELWALVRERENERDQVIAQLEELQKRNEEVERDLQQKIEELQLFEHELEELRQEKELEVADANNRLHYQSNILDQEKKRGEQLQKALRETQQDSEQSRKLLRQLQEQNQLIEREKNTLAQREIELQDRQHEALAAISQKEKQQQKLQLEYQTQLEKAKKKSEGLKKQLVEVSSELEDTLAKLRKKEDKLRIQKRNSSGKLKDSERSPTGPTGYLESVKDPIFKIATKFASPTDIFRRLWGHSGPLIKNKNEYKFFERRGTSRASPIWRVEEVATSTSYIVKKFDLPAYKTGASTSTPTKFFGRGAPEPPKNLENSKDVEEFTKEELHRSPKFFHAFREPLILTTLDHPYIIKPLGMIRETSSFYEIFPYIQADLGYICASSQLTMKNIQTIFYQMFSALFYLHSGDVVHRDIKPSSILVEMVGNYYKARLTSFTQARSLNDAFLGDEAEKSLMVPLPNLYYNIVYMAPELAALQHVLHKRLERRKNSDELNNDLNAVNMDWKKCDVWSMGITMAEVIRGGRVLLMSKNAKQLVHDVLSIRECRPKDLTVVNKLPIRDDWPKKENTIFRAQIENWPSNIAKPNKEPIPLVFKQDEQDLKEKCLDLIASILQFDPQVRPSADRVLAHPFFADIHKNEPVPCTKKYEVLDSCLVNFVQEKCGGFT